MDQFSMGNFSVRLVKALKICSTSKVHQHTTGAHEILLLEKFSTARILNFPTWQLIIDYRLTSN